MNVPLWQWQEKSDTKSVPCTLNIFTISSWFGLELVTLLFFISYCTIFKISSNNKTFFNRLNKLAVEKKSSLPFAKSYEKLHLTTLRGFVDRREKFLSDILQIINPLEHLICNSATTFLEKCRKVVQQRWIYGIKPPFFLVNHFSRTRFLEPDFSNHFSRKVVAD